MASTGEDVMERWVQHTQGDLPKIDAAVKNLLAQLMTATPAAPPSSSSSPAHEATTAGDAESESNLTPAQALDCARVFLRAVQDFPLLSVDEFCTRFPQREDQSAIDRLDQVCHYKAIAALHAHTLCNGALSKVSKVFGKDLFIVTLQWPDFRLFVLSRVPSASSAPIMVCFLDLIEKSLFPTDRSAVLDNGVSDLMWTTNFSQALRQRQEARAKAVAERLRETSSATQLTDTSFHEELVSLVESVRAEPRDSV